MERCVSRLVTIKVFFLPSFLLFTWAYNHCTFFWASFLFISKMANKDRRSAAAHNTDEVLTHKHSMCFVLPEGVSLEEALLTIGELIGCENIQAASQMNHKIVVFVSKVQLAYVVVQNVLVLGDDQYVPDSSWDTPASKILLSNVLPTLSEEEILGTMVLRIIKSSMRIMDGKLKHIETFRRLCSVVLKEGVTQLNVSLVFKTAKREHRVFCGNREANIV